MKEAIKKKDFVSIKAVSADLLKNASGGVETGDEAPGTCPYCGGKLEWLEMGNDNVVRTCWRCVLIF